MSMIPMAGVVSGRGSQPDVHRKSAWSRLRLAEAAVPWGTHIHLGQEERQSWMAEGCIAFSSLVTAESGLAGPGEAGAAAGL